MDLKGVSVFIRTPFALWNKDRNAVLPLGEPGLRSAYMDALNREISIRGKLLEGRNIHSIRVGGGNATTLPVDKLARMLLEFKREQEMAPQVELVLSAEPQTLLSSSLSALGMCDYTGIRLKALSATDRLLSSIAAPHTCEELEDCLYMLDAFRCPAIDSVLLYGIPGQTEKDMCDALMVCTALPQCDHVTLRPYKDGSREALAKILCCAEKWLTDKNFISYGNRRFARKGGESIYEISRNNGTDRIGFGLGAVTVLSGEQWENTSDIETYLNEYSRDV